MTQIELDASDTWLPNGSTLMLNIPTAKVSSQIMIPWRYRFLVSFDSAWEQDVILEGDAQKVES